METLERDRNFVRVANLADLSPSGCHVVYVAGKAIALFQENDQVYAIDNRCPHMGFPLHKGTAKDGILICHWHHARFDLASGGTFDLWADDVQSFPVEVRESQIWVDLSAPLDRPAYQRQRLIDGLEQNISLVIAKAVLALMAADTDPAELLEMGLTFGARYRREGWGAGLTILTCMANLLPSLDPADRPLALYHGLSAVARDCAGSPPRFDIQPLPLPQSPTEFPTLKRWFREFVEVRDAQGAERCLVSAIRGQAQPQEIADMLFAAATDHRFLDGGHTLDFTNKALEALDLAGWQQAEAILPSLVRGYTEAERMEESSAWRSPVDLVAILERAFSQLPEVWQDGQPHQTPINADALVSVLLGDNPEHIAQELLQGIRQGYSAFDLAQVVTYAAAQRLVQFSTNNDFQDWDIAHHTFTFANAVCQGLRRVPTLELLRGVFDAAMRIYLNRFLNMPPVPLPQPGERQIPEDYLQELPDLLDRQQQVKAVGQSVVQYLFNEGDPQPLLAHLGKLLLREDRNFHTIQEVEATFRQYGQWPHAQTRPYLLVAAARYLAAHAPTNRAQGQTYQIA
ncbi:MAG: Rieske 2Fe-2S domain-containing protein, partial [Acaryochloris sp. RU_4_1]|nr:Rieske 2Fe-2S domain-containing protein [Acaryochloris sp. RU_4_1]